jgi:hypothetical protein
MKLYSLDVKKINYENVEENPYLGEIDIKPDLYEVFSFNGKWYVLGIVAANKEYAGVHQLKKFDLDETETNYESHITCPICGYVDMDSWKEDDGDYRCGQCGAILEVERNVEVTYSATVSKLPTVLEG